MIEFLFKKRSLKGILSFETDIHCHLLPDVDHGAPDVDTSARLMEWQYEIGLRRVVMTPHQSADVYPNTTDIIKNSFMSVEQSARRIGIKIYPSAEYRADELMLSRISESDLLPFAGYNILVENSFYASHPCFDEVAFKLLTKGYNVIIAHPERYLYYNNVDYERLRRSGFLFQINLLSLSGYHGEEERRRARAFCKAGWCDFVATDLHHQRHVDSLEKYLVSTAFRNDMSFFKDSIKNDNLMF